MLVQFGGRLLMASPGRPQLRPAESLSLWQFSSPQRLEGASCLTGSLLIGHEGDITLCRELAWIPGRRQDHQWPLLAPSFPPVSALTYLVPSLHGCWGGCSESSQERTASLCLVRATFPEGSRSQERGIVRSRHVTCELGQQGQEGALPPSFPCGEGLTVG